jgi:hypothetical protein
MEASGAALGVMLAGVVNEDLAHDVGGEANEVSAVGPVDVFAGEADISFVDEGGGLEGVAGALATHVGLGEAVKLGVNEREQAVGGGGIAGMHGFEELGYLTRIGLQGTPRSMTVYYRGRDRR